MYDRLAITVLVDNCAVPPLTLEHGLALWLHWHGDDFLFDTGAGNALLPNLRQLHISPESITCIVLSHGHNDHTGGLQDLIPEETWFVPGLAISRCSRHSGKPIRDLSLPEAGRRVLQQTRQHEVRTFTEIRPGLFLTGPIPRKSGEDCGGPFFLDPEGTQPDLILDEQALLTADGTLVQGCCHAGIINTLDYCRAQKPDIPVRTIIGGLHLLHASPERLERTAAAIRRHEIQTLVLLHCTGENSIRQLRQALPEVEILSLKAGETFPPAPIH